MRYEEYLRKLKEKRKVELIINEYNNLVRELLEMRKITLTVLTILLGFGDITIVTLMKLTISVQALTIIYTLYFTIALIIVLMYFIIAVKDIERNINALRDLLIENCVITMSVRETIKNNIHVIGLMIGLTVLHLILFFIILLLLF